MKQVKFMMPLVAAICCAALFSCSNKHSISAHIDGLGDGQVIVRYARLDRSTDMVTDSLLADNGRFTYDITDTAAVNVYIHFPKQSYFLQSGDELTSMLRTIFLVLRPGEKVSVKGSVEDPAYLSYSASGTLFNSDYAAHRGSTRSSDAKADSIIKVMDSLAAAGEPDSVIQPLEDQYRAQLKAAAEVKEVYIKANPGNDLSAYYLLTLGRDSFEKYYGLLTDQAKNGLFADNLVRMQEAVEIDKIRQEAAKGIVPGVPAPDFTLTSMDGQQVGLSSLRGKYVVLDFWGSWCGWCIKGVPDMKKYHDKYKNKITFVGIACRDADAKWREAVAKYGMDWLQLFNPGDGGANELTVRYAIQGYPTKIILDKDLKIIEVFIGETPEFYKKLDSLK